MGVLRAANDPAEWRRFWDHGITDVNPWWPIDGRETVYDPYEALAPTDTVGAYREAVARVEARDGSLPADFAHYLAQRLPGALSDDADDACPIDRRGLRGRSYGADD
jgi:hypothetical protein